MKYKSKWTSSFHFKTDEMNHIKNQRKEKLDDVFLMREHVEYNRNQGIGLEDHLFDV